MMKCETKKEWNLFCQWKYLFPLLTLCWLPYCILHYPGRFGGGSTNQVSMFYGMDTLARNMSSIVYEGHYITNHHPVLLTLYYGLFFKVGNIINNTNVAVFCMSLLNLLISSSCMAYSLVSLKKYIKTNAYYILVVFVIINPIFGMYSYTCCKDNLFSAVMLVFYTCFFEMIETGGTIFESRIKRFLFLMSSILVPFLKNQGLIIIVISLLVGAIILKTGRKKLLALASAIFILDVIIVNTLLFPMLKIAPGGKQEALSVPFNQTAAYFQKYATEITEEEYEIVNRVLPADTLAEDYHESRADSVKFNFKQSATSKDLIAYFKVWFSQLRKHPKIYISSWFKLAGGYIWPGYEKSILDLYGTLDMFDAKSPNFVESVLEAEDGAWDKIINTPIIKYLFRPGFYSLILMLTIIVWLLKRDTKVFSLIPILLNLIILLLCPWNGVMRYELPVLWGIPIEMTLLFYKKSADK